MIDGFDLLIPGPISLDPSVLDEMAKPIVPHYGADWTAYYLETIDRIKSVFQTTGKVYAIPGSGSAGLEAALSSAVSERDQLLVLSNGFFGERVAAIALSHHPKTVVEQFPTSQPLCVDDLEGALAAHPGTTAVAVVHSESSSGLFNPVKAFGAACDERGLLYLVDAISSLGGIELSMESMNIDVCISASQKCLEGPPGLGLVAVAPSAWERIKDHKSRGWYLNLQNWEHYATEWRDWHPYPITMAVPAFRALRVGIDRVLAEGLAERWQRHVENARWIVQETSRLGCEPVFEEKWASPTVVALRPPAGQDAQEVVRRLRAEYRILIAGGMGVYKPIAFRIGNMGDQATRQRVTPLIDALKSMFS